MGYFVPAFADLIDEFNKLPGIGKKSAQRLAFYMLNRNKAETDRFIEAIKNAKEKIRYCECCQNLSETELCSMCASSERDKGIICVVESPKDVIAFEGLNEYKGVYHVLHGVISPLDEVGPDDIRIKELLHRVTTNPPSEIILATNPNTEGETTAMYIAKLLSPFCSNITRLANGLPVGADIEYADEGTLLNAFEGRRKINQM